MSEVTVQAGQTLFDVAVENFGSEESVFDLARLNGLNLTDDLTPGMTLSLPEGKYKVRTREKDATVAVRTATVKPSQTLIDISVQYLGGEQGVYAMARLNGLNLTDDLVPGTVLELPDIIDKRSEYIMRTGGYFPASESYDASIEELCSGIGCWIIELEFLVS